MGRLKKNDYIEAHTFGERWLLMEVFQVIQLYQRLCLFHNTMIGRLREVNMFNLIPHLAYCLLRIVTIVSFVVVALYSTQVEIPQLTYENPAERIAIALGV